MCQIITCKKEEWVHRDMILNAIWEMQQYLKSWQSGIRLCTRVRWCPTSNHWETHLPWSPTPKRPIRDWRSVLSREGQRRLRWSRRRVIWLIDVRSMIGRDRKRWDRRKRLEPGRIRGWLRETSSASRGTIKLRWRWRRW